MTTIEFDPMLAAELAELVPLDEQASGDWRDVERRAGHSLCPRRRLLIVATLAATLAALLVTPLGGAIARGLGDFSDWLTGSPAPKAVVDDFGAYAPQLGFNPEPGSAVLVAEDGDVSLYATTNMRGSYCILASAPWKRPSKLAGSGTCISPANAAAPLIAGLVGASSSEDGENTYLIAGRTDDPQARTIRFTDPNGDPITGPTGSSGFFIAAVHTTESACANGDWNPTFSVLAANGEERSHATITLGYAPANTPGVCGFPAPHAP